MRHIEKGAMMQLAKAVEQQFDFEVGYLVKSPCRDCLRREEMPRCTERCITLDRVQRILCEATSCSRDDCSSEGYRTLLPEQML